MQLYVIMLHMLLEMMPISSSLHIQRLGEKNITQSDIYAAHGPAAIVLGVFVLPLVVMIARNREYRRLLRWCICGCIADGVTVLGYSLKLIFAFDMIPSMIGLIATITSLLYVSYPRVKQQFQDPTYAGSWIVGGAQVAALIPGASRLALTYAAGRFLGWEHRCAFTFSCALAVPLYAGYWMYMYRDLLGGGGIPYIDGMLLLIAGVIAYGLLWITERVFAHRYAWIFAVYISVFVLVTALY